MSIGSESVAVLPGFRSQLLCRRSRVNLQKRWIIFLCSVCVYVPVFMCILFMAFVTSYITFLGGRRRSDDGFAKEERDIRSVGC